MSDEREPRHAGHWIGWVLAVGVTFAVAAVAAFYIAWGDSAGCGQTPTLANRAAGFHHLGIAAVILSGAWTIGAVISRRVGRMIIGLGVGLLPIAGAFVALRHVTSWHSGFCF